MNHKPSIFIWALLAAMLATHECYPQSLTDYDKWSERLSSRSDDHNNVYWDIYNLVFPLDSASSFNFYNELQKRNPDANEYFNARLHCLIVYRKLVFHQYESKSEIIILTQQILNEAYESDDQHLIGFISFECGKLMLGIGEMELAGTYLLKGQEVSDRLGGQTIKEQYSNYVVLGEALFHCQEYSKSLYYTRRVIDIYNDTISNADYYRARFYNTMGQNYLKLNKLDSALAYFDTSLTYAKNVNDETWQGINSGFIGQVLYVRKELGKAKPLLEVAYTANKDNEKDHAAKALQWLARIDLDQGHLDSALIKCNLAVDILKGLGQTYYLQTSRFLELAYITAGDIHRAKGHTDSFYYYSRLYSSLHDSLQTVSLLSSSKVSQLRVDNENNYREIRMLHREKDIEKMKRNFLIVAIVLLSLVVLLYVKRLLLKQKHREQMTLQEQKVAETELEAARQQMKQFTENIIEKSELIDRLKLELSNRAISHEQQEVIEALSHQTILTEADWDNFKRLFEKVYPGFFMHIKEKAADITLAEQRMAALTRLNLTSRQMASMLGISVDSVHKTKQRLRHRLHITADENLEQSVAGI